MIGMMEYWNSGTMGTDKYDLELIVKSGLKIYLIMNNALLINNLPVFHHSSIHWALLLNRG
jgi:hypothetical protein